MEGNIIKKITKITVTIEVTLTKKKIIQVKENTSENMQPRIENNKFEKNDYY